MFYVPHGLTSGNFRRAIVPIGIMFSLSLIFGNMAYMYLSVSFIQMLKVSVVCLQRYRQFLTRYRLLTPLQHSSPRGFSASLHQT